MALYPTGRTTAVINIIIEHNFGTIFTPFSEYSNQDVYRDPSMFPFLSF